MGGMGLSGGGSSAAAAPTLTTTTSVANEDGTPMQRAGGIGVNNSIIGAGSGTRASAAGAPDTTEDLGSSYKSGIGADNNANTTAGAAGASSNNFGKGGTGGGGNSSLSMISSSVITTTQQQQQVLPNSTSNSGQ